MCVLMVLLLLSLTWCPFTMLLIKTGNDLVKRLCDLNHMDITVSSNLTIILNHSLIYNVTLKQTCVVSISGSLTIESDTSDIVTVHCVNQSLINPQSTVAFGFIDTDVTIRYVIFSGCGAFLQKMDDPLNKRLSSSKLHFNGSHHSALFVFMNSSVNFYRVNITNYYGFAVIGLDLKYSRFSSVGVTMDADAAVSSQSKPSIGSGILILFNNQSEPFPYILSFYDCYFYRNYDFNNRFCVDSLTDNTNSEYMKNAAALTIIFSQTQKSENIKPLVVIEQTSFIHNTGSYCSGVMILMLNSTTGIVRIGQGTRFISNNNYSPCPGSAVVFFMSVMNERSVDFSPLELNDVTFKNQDGLINGIFNAKVNSSGTVYIYVANLNGHVSFPISKVSFFENSGGQFGTCVLAIIGFESNIFHPKAKIILENVTASNNDLEYKESFSSDIGLFTFENVNEVLIEGSCNHPSLFNGNKGSVIYAHNSNIYLNGYVTFSFNRAMIGAAFNMKDSYLHFNDDLSMTLINNYAQVFGGAIHIVNSYITVIPRCALQILTRHKITNINNTAGFGGNIVYGYPIYHCLSTKRNNLIENVSYYSNYFDLNDSLDVSSIPHSLNYCGSNSLNGHNHYPGETIELNFSALDYAHNSVYISVEVSLMKDEKAEELVMAKSSLMNSERVQVLSESKRNSCSVINITVFYHDRLGIWGEANCTLYVRLLSHQFNIMSTVKLNLTHCPPGFKLDHSRGVCKCSSAIKKIFTSFSKSGGECDINTLTISMPPSFFSPWIGIYSDSGNIYAQVASICTTPHCMPNGRVSSITFDERSGTFLLKNSSNMSRNESFCRPHRKGVVCGECEEGYSEVFGTGDCMKCSNWWLLTIVFYAIAGPIVIFLMYSLRLTLTNGVINGIIFYVQTTNLNVLPVISYFSIHNQWTSRLVFLFLSSMNLNLGFPMCLYDGMNQTWESGLYLVFPIYLLSIVVVIILLSHNSTWLSNKTSRFSVQVLITIVHISFSNLLIATVNVIVPLKIYMDKEEEVIEHLVWINNGNVQYGSPVHILLITITLVTVSFFIIPYLTVLIGGRYFIRSSFGDKYLRAAFEAIHGSYKEKRKYWFTARLFLLITMFTVYSSISIIGVSTFCVISVFVLIFFLFVQLHLKPFKSTFINVVDSTLLLNLIVLYHIGWYITVTNEASKIQTCYIISVCLVAVVFIQFVSVIVYRVCTIFKSRCAERFFRMSLMDNKKISAISCHQKSLFLFDANDSFYYSCNDFREPLAGSD